ncbi:MAG TPA: vitamin K epoxide reductase family protein, partial [Ktedonobacterales bacterium]|nr:vitamin K epoxide reductase family protein [Ktedonobacterales bacterium]
MAEVSAEGSSDGLGARLMLLARRAPGLVAVLAMALVGLGISIYLTTVHYQGVAPVCNTTGVIDCAAVTSSTYSVLPGPGKIPITIPGMIWFLASGGMALVALLAIWRNRREPSRLRLAHLLWGALGMVFVLYLVYAEIVVLHRLCEWCTVVHLLTLITFLIVFNRWL